MATRYKSSIYFIQSTYIGKVGASHRVKTNTSVHISTQKKSFKIRFPLFLLFVPKIRVVERVYKSRCCIVQANSV